jgi:SagB-type dehydrogenase family enzyme
MRRLFVLACCVGALGSVIGLAFSEGGGERGVTALPAPVVGGTVSLERAIADRRSIREFADASVTLKDVGQLCWAGQGITEPQRGLRASPSAGALYPIELYVVTREGVDHYVPRGHKLDRVAAGDVRGRLQAAALHQEPVGQAPVCVVIAAVVERTAGKYGRRAERYCFMEAGHVAQNVLLQATALGLGGVPVGAFDDADVAQVLGLPKGQRVLYLLPIGYPALFADRSQPPHPGSGCHLCLWPLLSPFCQR